VTRWRLILPALLAAAAGCGNRSTQAENASPAAAPSSARTEVVLDAAAQKQAGLAIEEVRPRAIPETLAATGRITLDESRTWRIGASTEGRVVRILAQVGDRVGQGQALALLYSPQVHDGRAEYRRAVSELARVETAESYALRSRDRARRLHDLKAASLEQVEHAEADLRNAQAAVQQAATEVERRRAHLVEFLNVPAEASSTAQGSDADLVPIRSPAAGILLERRVTTGTVVASSGELFVVADLDTLWMIASVPEENLSRLRSGTPVLVSVQAHPGRRFRGAIQRLGEQLDTQTRTLQVRVELPNPDGLLKPEMYAMADLETGGSRPGIFLPQSAVQEIHGVSCVFVSKDANRFEARPVQTARVAGSSVEIAEGIRAGERVVVRGAFVLKSEILKASLAEE